MPKKLTLKELDQKILMAQADYRAALFEPRRRIELSRLIDKLKEQRANMIGRNP